MHKLVYLDTETTGLNPNLHDVWEIAIIDQQGREHAWMIKPDLTHADPKALEVSGYYTRHFTVTGGYTVDAGGAMVTEHWDSELIGDTETSEAAAQQVAELLSGAVVVGSNPDFDRQFLTRWLGRHGQVWAAHYRTIDVTTLGHGYLAGCEPGYDAAENTPPDTHKVAKAFGIDHGDYDRHTALGDARMVRDLYNTITKEN